MPPPNLYPKLICLFDLDAPRLAPIIPGTNGLLVLPLLWILTHGNDNEPFTGIARTSASIW